MQSEMSNGKCQVRGVIIIVPKPMSKMMDAGRVEVPIIYNDSVQTWEAMKNREWNRMLLRCEKKRKEGLF